MIAVAALAAAGLAGCAASGEPQVGKSTNMDLERGVELDVKVVDCGDSEATAKITKEAKARTDCAAISLQYGDKVFCAEPLKGAAS
jgi:hypothetical protein